MFRNREDAALQLAEVLSRRDLHDPLVLAIPRGGIVTGAVLARALNAELDVVLSRKLRAPGHPESAIGAVCEGGQIYLNPEAHWVVDVYRGYLGEERRHQMAEIDRRRRLFRAARPQATIAGRTVIVTDDGIATGSTMIAALRTTRARRPQRIIAAVPVASPDSLDEVRQWCDEIICLQAPPEFMAVGQFYQDFEPVEDREVIELLCEAAERAAGRAAAAAV